jgi:hypothetical protein
LNFLLSARFALLAFLEIFVTFLILFLPFLLLIQTELLYLGTFVHSDTDGGLFERAAAASRMSWGFIHLFSLDLDIDLGPELNDLRVLGLDSETLSIVWHRHLIIGSEDTCSPEVSQALLQNTKLCQSLSHKTKQPLFHLSIFRNVNI